MHPTILILITYLIHADVLLIFLVFEVNVIENPEPRPHKVQEPQSPTWTFASEIHDHGQHRFSGEDPCPSNFDAARVRGCAPNIQQRFSRGLIQFPLSCPS